MCVIFVAHAAHPRYPLIVAANRDEFHTRPTAAAAWWTDEPIFAGRDLTAGGTWLGVSRTGRFAAITNFHDAPPSRPAVVAQPPSAVGTPAAVEAQPPSAVLPSRGNLVSGFLTSSTPAGDFVRGIDRHAFNGFSLFVHDGDSLAFVSNRYGEPISLSSGLYGLANASLDSDEPRVRELKRAIGAMIKSDAIGADRLIAALARSPLFFVHPVHGTRCSTAVLVDADGEVTFVERQFGVDGSEVGEVREKFLLET